MNNILSLETKKYALRLNNFEGPLDLLLHLIKQEEFEIKDIKVKESDIISWANYNGFNFLQCACKMTEKNADIELMSKRKEIKQLIADIKLQNPEADDNIFRSLHNVNMATMPGWRDSDNGDLHSFLEKY